MRVLNCGYLSDLHFCTITAEQARALQAMDVDMFSAEDYRRAARYLVAEGDETATAQALRTRIITFLQAPK